MTRGIDSGDFFSGLAESLAGGIYKRLDEKKDAIKEQLLLAKQVGLPQYRQNISNKNNALNLVNTIKANVDDPNLLSNEFFFALAGGEAGVTLDTVAKKVQEYALKGKGEKFSASGLQEMVSLNNFVFPGSLEEGFDKIYNVTVDRHMKDPSPKTDTKFSKNLLLGAFAANPLQDAENYLRTASIMGLPVNDLISKIGQTKGTIEGLSQVTPKEGLTVFADRSQESIINFDDTKDFMNQFFDIFVDPKTSKKEITSSLDTVNNIIKMDFSKEGISNLKQLEISKGMAKSLAKEGTRMLAEGFIKYVNLKQAITGSVFNQGQIINERDKYAKRFEEIEFDANFVENINNKVSELYNELNETEDQSDESVTSSGMPSTDEFSKVFSQQQEKPKADTELSEKNIINKLNGGPKDNEVNDEEDEQDDANLNVTGKNYTIDPEELKDENLANKLKDLTFVLTLDNDIFVKNKEGKLIKIAAGGEPIKRDPPGTGFSRLNPKPELKAQIQEYKDEYGDYFTNNGKLREEFTDIVEILKGGNIENNIFTDLLNKYQEEGRGSRRRSMGGLMSRSR